MEPQKKKSKAVRNVIAIAVVIAAAAYGVWLIMPRAVVAPFCFDFSHDMQFGDRIVAHPVNMGRVVNKLTYYVPEVPALQEALRRQGLYIDPYESTGGGVYAAAFFGPTTKSAVGEFQKKYGLVQTGVVDNPTLDKLNALYACPPVATSSAATSSPR